VAYTVELLETALEELGDLPKETQRQILKRIEGLKTRGRLAARPARADSPRPRPGLS
jgi:mRNA-degrading endonuclease RelE of RelBE toxin-antitoxin system